MTTYETFWVCTGLLLCGAGQVALGWKFFLMHRCLVALIRKPAPRRPVLLRFEERLQEIRSQPMTAQRRALERTYESHLADIREGQTP